MLLREERQRQLEFQVRVGVLLSEGATPADIASILGVGRPRVDEAMTEIAKVAHRVVSSDDA